MVWEDRTCDEGRRLSFSRQDGTQLHSVLVKKQRINGTVGSRQVHETPNNQVREDDCDIFYSGRLFM